MGALRIGGWIVEVDEAILQLAAQRSAIDPFRVDMDAGQEANLRLVLVERLEPEAAVPLNGQHPGAGAYALKGDVLMASIPSESFAAEACLRALFEVATARQGGLLLHGAAISFGGLGVVVTGPSGAGKSTLARFCVQATGQLLSDETVALYPDGTVHGSPFVSDYDLVGRSQRAKLGAILLLEKGNEERLDSVRPDDAVVALLRQAYRPAPREATSAQLLQRACAFTARPGVQRLTFRKHPDAGAFVQRQICELQRS